MERFPPPTTPTHPALTRIQAISQPVLAPCHLLQASCGLSVRKCGSRACAVTSWTGGTSWIWSSSPCTWRPSLCASSWPGLHTSTARMPPTGLPATTSPRLVSAPERSPESPGPLSSLALGLSASPRPVPPAQSGVSGARRTPSSWLRCYSLSPACSASPAWPTSCRPTSRWAPCRFPWAG